MAQDRPLVFASALGPLERRPPSKRISAASRAWRARRHRLLSLNIILNIVFWKRLYRVRPSIADERPAVDATSDRLTIAQTTFVDQCGVVVVVNAASSW
jgi:hypothetical protein